MAGNNQRLDARSRETGEAWFWSRSRRELWRKGATSGNTLAVEELREDCDGDAILLRVRPSGPTCHTGAASCFAPWLWRVVAERAARRVFPEGVEFAAASPAVAADRPPAAAPRLFARTNLRMNLGIGLSFAALTAIVYGLGAWMPSSLTAAGFSLEEALRASFALSGSSIAGALAAGYLARSLGSRLLMAASAVATCALVAALGLVLDGIAGPPDSAARWAIYLLAGAIGAAASAGVTTLYAMAALLYPPEIRSGGIGLGMTMGRIGGIAMSFAGGFLLDLAAGSALVLFGVLSASALLATTSAWVVRRHIPPRSAA